MEKMIADSYVSRSFVEFWICANLIHEQWNWIGMGIWNLRLDTNKTWKNNNL
jgi:hypothetical protein